MTVTLLFFFLLFSLASYRTTILLTDDDGPYDLIKKLRESQGIVHGHIIDVPSGLEVAVVNLNSDATMFGKMLYCPHCTSGWITLLFSALFSGLLLSDLGIFPLATLTICIWLGMWGVVRILIKHTEE